MGFYAGEMLIFMERRDGYSWTFFSGGGFRTRCSVTGPELDESGHLIIVVYQSDSDSEFGIWIMWMFFKTKTDILTEPYIDQIVLALSLTKIRFLAVFRNIWTSLT